MTDMFYAVNLVYTNLIYFRVEKIMFILQYKTMIHQNLHPKKKLHRLADKQKNIDRIYPLTSCNGTHSQLNDITSSPHFI